MNIEVTKKERKRPDWKYPRYGAPYLQPSRREHNSKPRVYVHPNGEMVLENFAKRFDRPITVYRHAAKQALKELGIEGKLRWSQKAGCSCGCSPGFVLDTETAGHFDILVTIHDEDHEEPLTERGANRVKQLKVLLP